MFLCSRSVKYLSIYFLCLTVADNWSESLITTTTTSALESVSSASESVSYSAGKSLNRVIFSTSGLSSAVMDTIRYEYIILIVCLYVCVSVCV